MQNMLLRLAKGGPERQAIEAGEIDAIIDYASSNVILLPAARAVLERKRAQAGQQESNRFARATLDALASQVYVLDSAGTVIMANKAWRASAPAAEGIAAVVPEGANFLAVCDNAAGSERAHGIAIAAGIRRVTGEESSLFRHEYDCDSPAGRCRFVVTVTGFREDGAARAVVARENITGRKAVEQPLKLGYSVAYPGRTASTKPAANAVNSLLASLPAEEYQRLLAALEPVTLTYGEVLYERGVPIKHAYFPVNCLVSLLTTVGGHEALEVGLVGHEGMVSVALALGIDVSPARALVQATGIAMRMEAARFREEFLQSISLQQALHRYAYALMAQIAQNAACNRFHTVGERLARWLLMTRDRVRSNEFRLTHAFLADMLGVRRVGVTIAANALQKRKLIKYGRGEITILDRKRLSTASCECYRIIKRIYDGA